VSCPHTIKNSALMGVGSLYHVSIYQYQLHETFLGISTEFSFWVLSTLILCILMLKVPYDIPLSLPNVIWLTTIFLHCVLGMGRSYSQMNL
jgi:hypothetical protein